MRSYGRWQRRWRVTSPPTSSRSTSKSLNEVINLHTSRLIAVIYARVPETIVLLLIVGQPSP